MAFITHAPILTLMMLGIIYYVARRLTHGRLQPIIDIKQQQIDLYKAKLAVGSPDEAAAKFDRLEARIEELSKAPAKWGD